MISLNHNLLKDRQKMTVDDETIKTLRQLHIELKLEEEVNMIRGAINLKVFTYKKKSLLPY